ncbi:uncharacterized protein METZ01_LOCUS259815, partial [marine metagenome]
MANITFNITLAIYFISTLGYTFYLVHRKPLVKLISFYSLGSGLFVHSIAIYLRSVETGHGPYTT